MPETSGSLASRYTLRQRIFLLLGSMDLAITLLLTLAIASIIGTVLQQNQPYSDYEIKFGLFWSKVFETLGLYDVYSSLWFISILCLLVISTSICVFRHTPSMLRDMWNLRSHVQEKSLRAMRHNTSWLVSTPENQTANVLMADLKKQGFRVKQTQKTEGILVSAMRGGMNRLGYILTHVAIIVICLGGLMDSNLPLKFAEWQGRIKIETRDLAVSKVPAESRLPVGNQAFRGSVHIAEGRSSEVAFVAMREGYLVQSLPFKLEVKDFRIEHYETGQPKLYETDLLVHDDDLAEPLATTISVNHPLTYKGYAIYQASFSDGGSHLSIDAWPLDFQAGTDVISLDTKVFENTKLNWGSQQSQIEMTEFRPFNINPDPTEDEPERLRDFGPSIGYKVRSQTGEAREFFNYMLPVTRDGREFYLSGVRSSPAENFGYLYLPADKQGELTGFKQFLERVRDKELVSAVASDMMLETLASIESEDKNLQQNLQETLVMLIAMFEQGGFSQVSEFIESSLPEAERESLGSAYLAMLREMLARIYFSMPNADNDAMVDESELIFLQDSVDAIGSLPHYGSPVFLMLTDYEQVQASGLQIAHAPGKPVVYLGCAFLIAGIFLLFYLPQRRLWALVKPQQNGNSILLAGMSNRNPYDFEPFFEQIATNLKQQNGNSP